MKNQKNNCHNSHIASKRLLCLQFVHKLDLQLTQEVDNICMLFENNAYRGE